MGIDILRFQEGNLYQMMTERAVGLEKELYLSPSNLQTTARNSSPNFSERLRSSKKGCHLTYYNRCKKLHKHNKCKVYPADDVFGHSLSPKVY